MINCCGTLRFPACSCKDCSAEMHQFSLYFLLRNNEQKCQKLLYHDVVSPGRSSGRLIKYHPFTTSFKKPFSTSRSLWVLDSSPDSKAVIPCSCNFLSSSRESANRCAGVAISLCDYYNLMLWQNYKIKLYTNYNLMLY